MCVYMCVVSIIMYVCVLFTPVGIELAKEKDAKYRLGPELEVT